MLIHKFHDQLQLWLRNNSGVISLLYVCSVLLMLFVFLLSMSIRMTDTDLWYHLTGGRFLFETGQLANPLDKSFIEPGREFLNYFWGFQAIAFSIWDVSGYLGLIVTKASLTLGTAWFLAKIVVMDKRFSQAGFGQLVLLSLIVFLLSTRFSFRPHVFSYFFTAFFIYTLMYREKWFRILPLATILWVNIHGVEWVIGGLICGSYVLQRSFAYMKNRDIQSLRSSLWVVACLPAVFVNPEGIYLLLAPFNTPSGVYEFVSELTKLQFVASINFAPGLTTDNVFLLLFPLGILSLIQAGRHFEQYIFSILLAVGGLILLSRGVRFIWEWLLLSTPLFTAGLQLIRSKKPAATEREFEWKGILVLLSLLLLLGYSWWKSSDSKNYPFNENSLPLGTSDFIEAMKIKGRYALAPSYAGYIEWRLSPDIQIHSDMQFPPFHELDFFEIHKSMLSKRAHQYFVEKYKPDLIGVRKTFHKFPTLLGKNSPYVPIFFDHLMVLYIDGVKYPRIKEKYLLKHINPYKPDSMKPGQTHPAIKEMKRMLKVTDNIPEVKLTLLGYLVEAGKTEEAKIHASSLLEYDAKNEKLQFYLAKIAHNEADYPRAIQHYNASIDLSVEPYLAQQLMAECYFHLGDHTKAYELFTTAIKLYDDQNPNLLHYYLFAFSSYIVGDSTKAKRVLAMFQILDDGSDPELSKRADELMKILED